MNKKLALSLGLLFFFAAPGCEGVSISLPGSVRNCELSFSEDPPFPPPSTGTQFDTSIPVGCPLTLQVVLQTVSFVTNGTFPYHGYTSEIDGAIYRFVASDAYHLATTSNAPPLWTYFSGLSRLHVDGSYQAASAGFNPGGVSPADYLRTYLHRIGDSDDVWGQLKAWYGQGPRASIIGPYEAIGWQGFDLDAELYDPTMVPPVAYSWTKNGVDMGISTSQFHYWGSPPDSNDDFEVTMTDLNGQTITMQHHVRTKNCSTDGCLDQ